MASYKTSNRGALFIMGPWMCKWSKQCIMDSPIYFMGFKIDM